MLEWDRRIKQLKDWHFEFFELVLTTDGLRLENVLSNYEYDLIERAMSGVPLNSNELHHFLLLADKFFAGNEAISKVAEAFIHALDQSTECFFNLQDHVVLYRLKRCIPQSISIEFGNINDEIVLEREKIMPESKDVTFKLLSFFSVHYSGIHINDFPLHREECRIVQEMIQPHTTSISLVNCKFPLDFQFDFSALTRLLHFECANCNAKQCLAMLETIPPTNLKYLDVTNMHAVNQESQLLRCLLRFANLEILKMSSVERQNWTDICDILTLPSLKHLQTNNILHLESFVNALGKLTQPLNLEYLDLSNNGYNDDLGPFFRKARKLSKLKYLNLSTDEEYVSIPFLVSNKRKCVRFKSLEQIVLDSHRYNV